LDHSTLVIDDLIRRGNLYTTVVPREFDKLQHIEGGLGVRSEVL